MKKVLFFGAAVLLSLTTVIASAQDDSFQQDLGGGGTQTCVSLGSPTGHCIVSGGVNTCSTTANQGDSCSGNYTPAG